MPPFMTPAICTSIGTTADGGLRMTFVTNELSDEDKLIAMKYHKTYGWLAFKPNQYALDELPKEQAEDKNKTPSKRQRALIFLIWKKLGGKGSFDAYYAERMNKNIERLKGELEDAI